jgi:hypothetical protein
MSPTNIKFYKLKTNEDLVAFEEEDNGEAYKIRRPLSFFVENENGAGRQMLNVKEWVPPIVCANDTVYLSKELVMFSMDVKETFKEEFIRATDHLYNITPKRADQKNLHPVLLRDPSNKPN